ncbi:MAG: hypothetical protein GY851_09230 [bacterium]|nr:hypothetical protein [bacterium]
MLIVRPSADFRVVSMNDPALDPVPRETMYEYGNTRNIDLLKLDELPDKPTVFVCRPLQSQFEHLAENPTPLQRWLVFATHVRNIEEFPVDIKRVERNGEDVIDNDMQDVIPPEFVREIADVIIEWASADGDTLPFSPPDSAWGTQRTQRVALAAMTARMDEAASTKPSE